MASSISSADGRKRSIIGLAKAAAGTSGAPRRITGPSSHSNASRATMAAISPENEPVEVGLGDDERLARLLRRVEDGLLVQRIQRPRLDDLGLYAVLFGELLGHFEGRVEHQAVGDDGDVRAFAVDAGLPEGDLIVVVGYLFLDEAVGAFVFEEEDGVGVADGALDHGLGVGGEGGRDDLEARRVAEPGLDALRVVEGAAGHDAVGGADGYGDSSRRRWSGSRTWPPR